MQSCINLHTFRNEKITFILLKDQVRASLYSLTMQEKRARISIFI